MAELTKEASSAPCTLVMLDPTAYREYIGFLYRGPVRRTLRLAELASDVQKEIAACHKPCLLPERGRYPKAKRIACNGRQAAGVFVLYCNYCKGGFHSHCLTKVGHPRPECETAFWMCRRCYLREVIVPL